MFAIGWCPYCGGELTTGLKPFCTSCGERIPLHVRANAVAQFLLDVPTVLEFQFLNPSDSPVSIERLEFFLDDARIPPEDYGFEQEVTIPPGGAPVWNLSIGVASSHFGPGPHTLQVRISGDHGGEPFTFSGAYPIVIDEPGAQRIHVYDAREEAFNVFEGASLPDIEAVPATGIGEEAIYRPELAYIARLKAQAGWRFLPVPLRSDSVPRTPVAPSPVTAPYEGSFEPRGDHGYRPKVSGAAKSTCPHCNASLVDIGQFCHECGRQIRDSFVAPTRLDKPNAYCPHCQLELGLSGQHRYCPYEHHDGRPIHVHLQMDRLSMYLREVGLNREFYLHVSAPERVRIRRFDVALNGVSQADGRNPLPESGVPLHPGMDTVLHKHIEPEKEGGTRDEYLDITLVYDYGENRYTLRGREGIQVYDRPKDTKEFTQIINKHITVTEGAGATFYKGEDVSFDTGNMGENDIRQYLAQVERDRGRALDPVYLRTYAVEPVPTLPPPPDWEPVDRASLWFEHRGMRHNYCVISAPRATFGRSVDESMVRLIEVERTRRNIEQQIAAGVPRDKVKSKSAVSGSQWELEATGTGLQLTVRSRQSKHSRLAPRDRQNRQAKWLEEREQVELGMGDCVEIHDIIGLRYAAHAESPSEILSLLDQAREALAQGAVAPARSNGSWEGPLGAIRLDRMYSLAGKPVKGCEDLRAIEYYVLAPGWATVGSSSSACITIPGSGVQPHHAYLLFLDGYYFVAPANASSVVRVADQEVPPMAPWPVKLGAAVTFGDTTVELRPWKQIG